MYNTVYICIPTLSPHSGWTLQVSPPAPGRAESGPSLRTLRRAATAVPCQLRPGGDRGQCRRSVGAAAALHRCDLSYRQMLLIRTSSTAQGGGGSFKHRKPIGEVGCCESRMAERLHSTDGPKGGWSCVFWNGCNGCSGHLVGHLTHKWWM